MKHLLIALLISLATLPAVAQSDPLGRLFFTPQQRAALDRERLLGFSQRPNTLDGDASYTFNGEVKRSSGKNTRWINGAPHTTATRSPDVSPGETYHPATGERESPLGSGKIIVQRKTPAP
jgi:hypothetical protein